MTGNRQGRPPVDRRRARGWAAVALFAAAAIFVLKDKSARELGVGAAIAVGLVALAFAFLAVWAFAPHLWRRLFPPPPPWVAPRAVSALFEADVFGKLQPRLDLLATRERESLWRDRETRQLWLSTAWDHEFTQNEVFEPVREPPDWAPRGG